MHYSDFLKKDRSIRERDQIHSAISAHVREHNDELWRYIRDSSSQKEYALVHKLHESGICCDFKPVQLDQKSFLKSIKKHIDHSKRVQHIQDSIDLASIHINFTLNEMLLRIASLYLGAPARLQQYGLLLNARGSSSQPTNAQRYHRDRDDYKTIELFLYLTDVGTPNGPHIYIPGTHTFSAIQKSKSLNRVIDHPLFTGSPHNFYDPASVENLCQQHGLLPKVLVGKAGFFFLEDTGGLHRGSIPDATAIRAVYGTTWTISKGAGFHQNGNQQCYKLRKMFSDHNLTPLQKYSIWDS